MKLPILLLLLVLMSPLTHAQPKWLPDGNSYAVIADSSLVQVQLPKQDTSIWVNKEQLVDPQTGRRLLVDNFTVAPDLSTVLLFTNSARVWRLNTRGDYYLWQKGKDKLVKIGRDRPAQSLMFAKLSPDGRKVAYVSEYNLYVEDLVSGKQTQLTRDGTRKFINGTFDWAYEEEFFCRDGYRWSPDGGAATLNLLFQYPEIFQTGIAGGAISNQLLYDNIYQERYMGLPSENREDFIKGSPVTHAKNLRGNLLYFHGTADDNVHYQNAELLINELVKHNRHFQLMFYPNRNHNISQNPTDRKHRDEMTLKFLVQHCPPGAR